MLIDYAAFNLLFEGRTREKNYSLSYNKNYL